MKLIEPYFIIESPFLRHDVEAMLRLIESAGRTCYKSEGKTTCDSAPAFVNKLANIFKHESIIEHCSVTVRFICDRGISHELVRHRLAAFSQESTRYCNYGKADEITIIRQPWWEEGTPEFANWYNACLVCETAYLDLLARGASPQQARSVLPNSLKTEIVMTCNLREWRHVFRLRNSSKAHPQMQQLMKPLAEHFHSVMPELFSLNEP